MAFTQSEYDIRCEWGLRGAETIARRCNAVIVVDVLSFTTAVSVAVSQGGMVFPYKWKDDSRITFAEEKGAILAGPRGKGSYSLSPASLSAVQSGQRIVLPSPNGATISLSTGTVPTYAGCLRNAKAVAAAASKHGPRIGVIPCGERWEADSSLRPALEDLIGAGAIIQHLGGSRSPEACAAVWAYEGATSSSLIDTIRGCGSGKELLERGYDIDVMLACEIDSDDAAPVLCDGAYQAAPEVNTAYPAALR
ncbi:2-phosphosulfolactate phosphatase [Thauera sp. Sel9]|uniref:2-phosphosulfolactate phosphatase n=1 Tax=Thauera sp. Sel9 TaxID=2974299 RepID=UPI0021E1311C|nr:2-phosphosulfolactate phosphatase [Thauera sp. Sel9]MCV2216605.1 2-phosphosulfolactate phosphatase [Thauera sp. Sel9]